MKYYSLTEKKTGKLLFGAFLFVMLYITRNSMASVVILGINKAQFLSLGLMCALGMVFLAVNRKHWKEILLNRRLLLLAVCSVVLLAPMLLKKDWQLMYFSVLLCLYFAVFLTYFISIREVAKYYVVFLSIIGAYSVVATYLLRLLPDNGLLSVPVVYNSREIDFYNFGLAYVSGIYVRNRNFGIFREPGVHQYFILLALFLNNYMVAWKKQSTMWILNVILAAAMLSTFATGGVAEMGLLAIVVFFDKKLYKDKRAVIIVLVLILILAVALGVIIAQKGTLYWELYGMVVSKLFQGEASSTERVDAILIDLDFFLKHPILGGKLAEVLYSVENNTTSTMLMFAIFGILGGALHTLSWAALVWEKDRRLWVKLALLLILFMSFNTQNLIADLFFWLFPMMALTEKWMCLKKKE